MLTPEFLQAVPDRMVALYALAEADILADMARRIKGYNYFITSAQHQLNMLEEMGGVREGIVSKLQKMTGKSRAEMEHIMQVAGMEALRADDAIYKSAGLSPSPLRSSRTVQERLQAGLQKTGGLFDNLTKTTANTAAKQFEQALDRAYMQVSSGAFSPDTATICAIKDLCRQGVSSIRYPTSHTDTIEVATRRAVITGVNQTTARMQEARADELGCDLVEVTAHAGARPEHAEWQGKIYSRSGKSKKYPDFVKSTGYGSGPGLCGWNCSHSFKPYFEGMPSTYGSDLLKDYTAQDYEYNGVKMTQYDALQKQREMERGIRRWKRENMAMEAAGEDTAESARKLKGWQERLEDFGKQTGLKRQQTREYAGGWTRSQAQKANWAARKAAAGVANTGKNGIIKVGQQNDLPADSFMLLDRAGYAGLRKAAGKISSVDRAEIWDHGSGYIQTGNSWTINKALRDGTEASLPPASRHTIDTLKKVIRNNTADRDFMAVRYADQNYLDACFGQTVSGLKPADIVAALRQNCLGQVLSEKAFMSVSMDPAKNVFTNKRVKLNVEVPKGANIYASSNYQESEAIMPTGVNYMLRGAAYINGQIVLTMRVLP